VSDSIKSKQKRLKELILLECNFWSRLVILWRV